jgi:hypothetical protein
MPQKGQPKVPSDDMKNIQVIDGALNCVYDIFSLTDEEFASIFPIGEDVAFIDEVLGRVTSDSDRQKLDGVFENIWLRPVAKSHANGIHGTLFYELEHKKQYYPTRRDAEAINPDGTPLRPPGRKS